MCESGGSQQTVTRSSNVNVCSQARPIRWHSSDRPFGAKQALTGTISKIEATTGGHVDITYTIDGEHNLVLMSRFRAGLTGIVLANVPSHLRQAVHDLANS